jgi:hypothetical protein
MEGMAELLGTHKWDSEAQTIALGVMPPNRDGFAMWGRTKPIRDAVAAGQPQPISAVLAIDNRRPLSTEQYAWCWALAKLLDTHPQYRERWRALAPHVLDPGFNQRFYAAFADDFSHLDTEWQLFTGTLDYGFDIEREAIDFDFGRELTGPQAECRVAADRGWQSTTWQLEAGRRYQLSASGQFVIAREADGTPWPCEANGVTLDYHAGRPLGQLLGVIDPRSPGQVSRKPGTAAFCEPFPLDVETTIEPTVSGTLYLRVNDSAAKLSDNQGELHIKLRRLPE